MSRIPDTSFESELSFQHSSEKAEQPSYISVEVWNTARINLPGGGEVSFDVDQNAINQYINSKLTLPFADDSPKYWKYMFDIRPKPLAGSEGEHALNATGGYTSYENQVVLINVAGIWQDLPPWDKTIEKLREEVCKVLVHETDHVRIFSNKELREQAMSDAKHQKDWKFAGKVLPQVFGILDGLLGGVALSRKLGSKNITRRQFLKILGLGGLGGGLGTFFSGPGSDSAGTLYDMYIDPTHRDVYQKGEESWREVIDFIKIKDYQLPS